VAEFLEWDLPASTKPHASRYVLNKAARSITPIVKLISSTGIILVRYELTRVDCNA
jgi:hypothetical protein